MDRTVGRRYAQHRYSARELLEAEALATFYKRVDVVAIDEDILRRVKRDWETHPDRRVQWDWERGIMEPLFRSGARWFHFALLVQGHLCALAAIRLSSKKRWLSLTYLEGAPEDHPLKGKVLPLAINALYIYRAVICDKQDLKSVGIRVLSPLDGALSCYKASGYSLSTDTKWLRSITIEEPIGASYDDGSASQDSAATAAAPENGVSAASGD